MYRSTLFLAALITLAATPVYASDALAPKQTTESKNSNSATPQNQTNQTKLAPEVNIAKPASSDKAKEYIRKTRTVQVIDGAKRATPLGSRKSVKDFLKGDDSSLHGYDAVPKLPK